MKTPSQYVKNPGIWSSVRMSRIKTMRTLQAMSDHAKRQDKTSKLRVRPDADSRQNIAWSKWSKDPFDYVGQFKEMKKQTGAVEWNGAAPVTHALIVISSEWLAEVGDIHDRANPRIRKMCIEAAKWAEATFGKGSVLAGRLDLDEVGSGVVDLMLVPTAINKKGKKYLSISPHLEELRKANNKPTTFAFMQDSWAAWCQERLDPRIQRGNTKTSRSPDRDSPEVFKMKRELEKAQKKLEVAFQDAINLAHKMLADGGVLEDVCSKEEAADPEAFQDYTKEGLLGPIQPQFKPGALQIAKKAAAALRPAWSVLAAFLRDTFAFARRHDIEPEQVHDNQLNDNL